MTRDEVRSMIGGGLFELGVEIANHDSSDRDNLIDLGFTGRGTHAQVDRRYVEADLKVLTGLVESHFMAGASGGPKSICPGLIGEDGTSVFHGPALMDDPNSRDLNLEGNPVYERLPSPGWPVRISSSMSRSIAAIVSQGCSAAD